MCGITMAAAKNTSSSVRHGPSASGVQGGQRGLVLQQPDFQAFRPAEDAVQGVEADTAEHHQLDQRLEGDGEHQSLVAFAGGDVASAEEDREQGDQGAEDECDPLLAGSRVRMLIESVTAWICRASIGSTPISMNSVVRAPAQVLRKRKAKRSASEDSW